VGSGAPKARKENSLGWSEAKAQESAKKKRSSAESALEAFTHGSYVNLKRSARRMISHNGAGIDGILPER
jgi:hypothetical protein